MSSVLDTVEVSLVIDDNKTINCKLNMNQIDPKSINALCEQIAKKLSLSDKSKKMIYSNLTKEIEAIKLHRQNLKMSISKNALNLIENNINVKTGGIINRLYYRGLEKKKKQEQDSERIKTEKAEEEIKNYSFIPAINAKSKLISSRNCHAPLVNRLYNRSGQKNRYLLSQLINHYKSSNFINTEYNVQIGKDKEMSYGINNKNLLLDSCEENGKDDINKKKIFQGVKNEKYIKTEEKDSVNMKKYINKSQKELRIFIEKENTIYNNRNLSNKRIITSNFNENGTRSSQWVERLYNNGKKKINQQEEDWKNLYLKEKYPFEPKLSEGTANIMKYRKETSADFYKRLSTKIIINNNNQTKPNSHLSTEKSNAQISQKKIGSKSKKNISHIYRYLSKENIKDIKKEEKLQRNIEQYEKDTQIATNYYQKNFNDNIEKFKFLQIKEIFDILTHDKTKIDFEALNENSIPKHIINIVVKPTCTMINNKNLEMNFENFYSISQKLLNNFLII